MNKNNIEDIFDINFYIVMNNDIAIRFKFDYIKIKEHFLNIGKNEKRIFSINHANLFYYNDWNQYISNNKDIFNNKINTEVIAFKHYLDHGINEKRTIYPKKYIKYELVNIPVESNYEIIDFDFFRKINKQYNTLDDNEIMKYISDNIHKSILYTLNHKNLYENYDWNRYLIDYPDLKINKIFNKYDALQHYLLFGCNEGRNINTIKIENNIPNTISNTISDTVNNTDYNTDDNTIDNVDNIIDNIVDNISNNIDNKCINILESIDNNDDNLIEIFKNNILENSNNIDISKYDISDISDINKSCEMLCLDFDYNYYYILNNNKFELKNDELECLEHFLKIGIKNCLPFSKNHYLLFINYSWDMYTIENTICNNEIDSFNHYIQNKYYFKKDIELPKIKYKIHEFINDFYNKLYNNNTHYLISYHNFLKIENKNKISPTLFNYFLYQIINWDLFQKENNLNLEIYELIHLFIDCNFDFKKYKVDFNTISTLNIPDKDKLIDLSDFNNFYLKIINYIKYNKNIHNIVSINKEFNKLFNKNLFDIPKNFNFYNYNPSYINPQNNNLSFNFVISYINKFEALYDLLLTIFYQNFNNYKIIIINKCDDNDLEQKIDDVKKSLNIINDIVIVNNKDINNMYFKNIINIFDINILIDTNYYLNNNNILEYLNTLYEQNNFCFEKITIEQNVKTIINTNLNSLIIINSNLLLNNISLLNNYFNINIDDKYKTIVNDLTIVNEINNIDHNIYNSDILFNNDINYIYPIFVLYQDKNNIKYIKNIKFYNLINIKEDNQFNNFIKYMNDCLIYDYIIIIFIDKVFTNFDDINFNYKSVENYNILNICTSSKIKNMKKKNKNIQKIDSYEAIICNNYSRTECIK